MQLLGSTLPPGAVPHPGAIRGPAPHAHRSPQVPCTSWLNSFRGLFDRHTLIERGTIFAPTIRAQRAQRVQRVPHAHRAQHQHVEWNEFCELHEFWAYHPRRPLRSDVESRTGGQYLHAGAPQREMAVRDRVDASPTASGTEQVENRPRDRQEVGAAPARREDRRVPTATAHPPHIELPEARLRKPGRSS